MNNPRTTKPVFPSSSLAVAIYHSHAEAKVAINELRQSGFSRESLSIIGLGSRGTCDRWGHRCSGIDRMGIPKVSVRRYEAALELGKSIVIVLPVARDIANDREMIDLTNPESVHEHLFFSIGAKADQRE